jgi:hypothetical protein
MPPISFEDIVLNRPHVRKLTQEYRALGTLAADLLLDDEVPADWGIAEGDGLEEIEEKASRSARGSCFQGRPHAAGVAVDGFVSGFFEQLWRRLGAECTAFVWWSDFGRVAKPH